MFEAFRILLENVAAFCKEIDKQITSIQALANDDTKIEQLLNLRTVARQLFEDITGVPTTTKVWGILHCERTLLKGVNPFRQFAEAVYKFRCGTERRRGGRQRKGE